MVKSLYKIGSTHKTNEDAQLIYENESSERLYLCVMDGCSGGIDSVFASHLFKKIIKSIFLDMKLLNISFEDMEVEMKYIFKELHTDLITYKKMLKLGDNELETTLGIAVINTNTNQYSIGFAGDGVYCVDNDIKCIDQDNIPNYLSHYSDIESVYNTMVIKSGIFHEQIGVSTDGVESFTDGKENYNMADFYFINKWKHQSQASFARKTNLLLKGKFENEPKMINEDDLSLLLYYA